MYYVLSFTGSFLTNEESLKVNQPEKLTFTQEIERFTQELKAIDNALAEKEISTVFAKRILQGPFSDILTHIGQLSMLQRLNGKPILKEDYSSASIKTGIQ